MKRFEPWVLVAFGIAPLIFISAPLVHLLTEQSWSEVFAAFQNADILQAFFTSGETSLITTGLAICFGLPCAFLMANCRSHILKRILEGILLMPLVLPPLVGGISELALFGPTTWIGGWFLAHGVGLTESLIGVILAQTFVTSPFMILASKAGFEDVPVELSEVTRLLGGGMWVQFWYVAIPLSRSAIYSGILLTFARSIGEFGATMMMAYHPYTIPVSIWVNFSEGGLSQILPIASGLTIVAVICIVISTLPSVKKKRETSEL